MRNIYIYFICLTLLLLTSCGYQEGERGNATESSNAKTYGVENSDFIVSREVFKREGYLINVNMEYPQLFIKGDSYSKELMKSLQSLNSLIRKEIFYDEIVNLSDQPFQATIDSEVTRLNDKIINIYFSGTIIDNGMPVSIDSSLTFDSENCEMIGLLDIVEGDALLKLINEEDFEVIPSDFRENKPAISALFADQIELALNENERYNDFYITEEHLILFTKVSDHGKETVFIELSRQNTEL